MTTVIKVRCAITAAAAAAVAAAAAAAVTAAVAAAVVSFHTTIYQITGVPRHSESYEDT